MEHITQLVADGYSFCMEEGLIYRGKYIVNWCPRCMTAISDLEVVHEDYAGKLYEIRRLDLALATITEKSKRLPFAP